MGGCYSKLNKKAAEGHTGRTPERRGSATQPSTTAKRSIPVPSVVRRKSLPQQESEGSRRTISSPASAASGIPTPASGLRQPKIGVSTSSGSSSASTVRPNMAGRHRTASGSSAASNISSGAGSTPKAKAQKSPQATKSSQPSQLTQPTTTRPHRSRSGNREHPYSRQQAPTAPPVAPMATVEAFQELRQMSTHSTEESYRNYKVRRRRRYISEPRSCDDNYNVENYTKRLSSETTNSATSSNSDRTLMSTGSSEDAKPGPTELPTSPASPDSAIGSQSTAPTPANETVLSTSTSTQAETPPVTSPSEKQPPPPAPTTSTASSIGDLSGRPAALSVSSLNSDDLMLTTDVGLDLEDDDIIKDIDDTEKEDPFVVANALATAGHRSKATVARSRSAAAAAGNNLTTPETISSAMSLVQQASGSARRATGSPRSGLVRKKSSPAATSTPDSAASCKVAVLRRIRASQNNAERPRSFSSPLRPPTRQRLTSTGGDSATGGNAANDETPVLIAQPEYRHINHDVRSVKLLLLRLKGMLLEDEGHQPQFAEQLSQSFYGHSNLSMSSTSIKRSDSLSEPTSPLTANDPFSPSGEEPILDLETASREALVQEVLMLRRTTTLLRTKLAEKETTVKLLQQQMTKYVCPGGAAETPPALESLRSFARHPFPVKPLNLEPSGGTEPSSPVVVDPAHSLDGAAASTSSASLPNGDAIGLSPRPSLGPRLRSGGARRERSGGTAAVARPSFLPVNMSQQGKRSISTGHIPHRKTTPLTHGTSH